MLPWLKFTIETNLRTQDQIIKKKIVAARLTLKLQTGFETQETFLRPTIPPAFPILLGKVQLPYDQRNPSSNKEMSFLDRKKTKNDRCIGV